MCQLIKLATKSATGSEMMYSSYVETNKPNNQMTTLKVKYYQDPGHGWIAVKRNLIQKLNIADQITSYSYQRGQTVYLEEDCDAYLFIQEMNKTGVDVIPEYVHTNNTSPIRSYDCYSN